MAQFVCGGRKWDVELDVITADEIKKNFDIDLLDAESLDKSYQRLQTDARLIVGIAWMLVESVAIGIEWTEDGFKRAMKPAAVRAAKDAIVEAIADFSPSPEVADAMKKVFRAADKNLLASMGAMSEEQLTAAMSASSAGNSAE